jgi:hypothetical protein
MIEMLSDVLGLILFFNIIKLLNINNNVNNFFQILMCHCNVLDVQLGTIFSN